jgi:hypothetical protein
MPKLLHQVAPHRPSGVSAMTPDEKEAAHQRVLTDAAVRQRAEIERLYAMANRPYQMMPMPNSRGYAVAPLPTTPHNRKG